MEQNSVNVDATAMQTQISTRNTSMHLYSFVEVFLVLLCYPSFHVASNTAFICPTNPSLLKFWNHPRIHDRYHGRHVATTFYIDDNDDVMNTAAYGIFCTAESYYRTTNRILQGIADNKNDSSSSRPSVENNLDESGRQRRFLKSKAVHKETDQSSRQYSSTSLYNTKANELEWEKYETVNCGTAYVLLPPLDVAQPSCIIHFIGGTFFGSTPALWYRTLLEEIVLNTNAAIIATSIPVTLLSSPLQHAQLAQKCSEQFRTAYRDVILEEYCYNSNEDDVSFDEEAYNFQRFVPICAIGHSLGARLLVVLTTMYPPSLTKPQSLRKRWWLRKSNGKFSSGIPPYQSFVLISFTNYGASTGIPGLYQLSKQSLNFLKERKKRSMSDRNRRTGDEKVPNDDNYIFDQFAKFLKQSRSGIKNALTPNPKDLEFHPNPQQLWNAVSRAVDGRYQIKQTLLVQFDNDPIDQSSKFCSEIYAHNADAMEIDVKFARLRGTHLTPISWIDPLSTKQDKTQSLLVRRTNTSSKRPSRREIQYDYAEDGWDTTDNDEVIDTNEGVNEQSACFDDNQTLGGERNHSFSTNREHFTIQYQQLELRQSISRYITDVVVPSAAAAVSALENSNDS